MRVKKEINIQVGEQVRLARETAKLTQEQLAERIDVSPQYVSDLERGQVGVSLSTLKRLCVSLGVSCDQILFGAPMTDATARIAHQCRTLTPEQTELLTDIVDRFVRAIELERKEK